MSEGKDDNWEMPKPVFRSSTGSLPKSFEETISQSFSPDKTGEIDADDDILGVMGPAQDGASKGPADFQPYVEPVDIASQPVADNTVRAKAAATPQPKSGGMSAGLIFLLIALLAGAVAAVYYFLNRGSGDTTLQ